jgi:cytochrome P450
MTRPEAQAGDRLMRYENGVRLPPGPRSPGLLQMAAYSRDPIRFLRRCQTRYGDVFMTRFRGLGRPIYVADRAEAKRIFAGSAQTFHAGEANARWVQPVLGPASIICIDESAHARQRRLLMPPFHGERMRRYGDLMAAVATREVERWPVGKPFRLLDATRRMTLEVILRAVVGVQPDRVDLFRRAILRLDQLSAIVLPLPPLQRDLGRLSPGRRFKLALAEVDELLYGEIARARRDSHREERDDVLALLVRARDEDGTAMPDSEIRDELMTLVAAGYETTAAALAWLFDFVLRTPHVRERLSAMPDDDEYADAVIRETLRLRAPLTDAARVLAGDAEIAGYTLASGSLVLVAIPLIHLHPDTVDDHDEFRPERFLAGEAEASSFVAFGGGRRRCVGAAFGQHEMKVVMQTVLQHARLRLAAPRPERPKLHHVVLVPARGVRVVLEERLHGAGAAERQAAALA